MNLFFKILKIKQKKRLVITHLDLIKRHGMLLKFLKAQILILQLKIKLKMLII